VKVGKQKIFGFHRFIDSPDDPCYMTDAFVKPGISIARWVMKLSEADKKIIRQIQGDLPLSLTPFAPLAKALGLPEEDLLKRIRCYMRRGIIRRFGAILRHQIAGFRGNALAVWKVSEDRLEKVAGLIASHGAVSHCYLRPSHPQWPYNLYAMIHGKNERECRRIAASLARKTETKDYRLLFSKRELKKSSMRYFEMADSVRVGQKH
jgi:DNA-binding Lrp family transcriptional regulator